MNPKTRPFFIVLTGMLLIVFSISCRKDLEYPPSSGNLEFSKDTVFLDTVFTTISSATYTLKVYNRTADDLEIPVIRLKQGVNSNYRLNVDGEAGKEFENIPIFAKDSLFIFIESTFTLGGSDELEFLNTETIEFDTGETLQEVALITLVKDAIFLYPRTLANGEREKITLGTDADGNQMTIDGFYLGENQLNFTNEKPYVIYGYAAVASEKVLNMAPGTRVHFHKDSGIIVTSGGSLQINGALSENQEALENEVIFESDRLQADVANIPGQWGTLWLAKGSMANSINHLTIRNATVGLRVEGDGELQAPTLRLKNTRIFNSASINLWGKSAFIEAENTVLGSAGSYSLYCNLGGSYRFVHTTIGNFWQNGFRTGKALRIDNFSDTNALDLTKAEFVNSIIDGNTFAELDLVTNQLNAFTYSFSNCIIKFNDSGDQFANNPLYDFSDSSLYMEVLFNENPDFSNTAVNDFSLKANSPAQDKANFEGANLVPLDILGRNRTGSPDIGAFEVKDQN